MYTEMVPACYDPHNSPEWGSSPPTALSKVGKYDDVLNSKIIVYLL